MEFNADVDMEEHDENSGGQPSPLPIVNRRVASDETSSSHTSQFTPSYGEDDPENLDDSQDHDENAPIPPIVVLASPVHMETKTRLKIRVNKLHITAEWKWAESGDDSCGICRMPFEACCVDCIMPGDSCPLVLGQCRHPFHMHCIVKWTETQNTPKPQCPLCRQEWKFAS